MADVRIDMRIRTSRLRRDLSRAQRDFRVAIRRMRRQAGALTSALSTAFLGIGAAVGAAVGQSVRRFTAFERELIKITTLVGIAREQTVAWREDLKRISRDTGRPLLEVARGLFDITSAGLRGADAIDALEVATKASAVGLGEIRVIAAASAAAVNAYGSANLSSEEAVSALVAAIREGQLIPDSVGQSLGDVISIAEQLGVSFEEVLAAMASLSRVGLNASRSATALRGIFTSLIRPTQETRKELDRVGLSIEDVRKTIDDDGLLAGLLKLTKAYDGNIDAIGRLFPQIEGLGGVLGLVGANAAVNERIFEVLINSSGDTEKAFRQLAKEGIFSFDQLSSELDVLQVNFGEAFSEVAFERANELTKVIRRLGDNAKEVAQVVINVGVALSNLAQNIARHRELVLQIIKVYLVLKGTLLITGVITGVYNAIAALGTILLITVFRVTSFSAAMVKLKTAFSSLATAFRSAFALIRKLPTSIAQATNLTIKSVRILLRNLRASILGVTAILISIRISLYSLGYSFVQVAKVVVAAIGTVLVALRKTLAAKAALLAAVGFLIASWREAGRVLYNSFLLALAPLYDIANIMIRIITYGRDITTVWRFIVDVVRQAGEAIAAFANAIANIFGAFVRDTKLLLQGFARIGRAIFDNLIKPITDFVALVFKTDAVVAKLNELKEFGEATIEVAQDAGRAVGDFLVAPFQDFESVTLKQIENTGDAFGDLTSSIGEDALKLKDFIGGTTDFIAETVDFLRNIFSPVEPLQRPEDLTELPPEVRPGVEPGTPEAIENPEQIGRLQGGVLGQAIVSGIDDAIRGGGAQAVGTSVLEGINNVVQSAASNVLQAGINSVFQAAFGDTLQGIIESGLTKIFSSAFDAVGSLLSGFIGAAGASAGGAIAAPTAHGGGYIPGFRGQEVPIIAQAGELVLTERQQQRLLGGGSGVNVTINATGDVTEATQRALSVSGRQVAHMLLQQRREGVYVG